MAEDDRYSNILVSFYRKCNRKLCSSKKFQRSHCALTGSAMLPGQDPSARSTPEGSRLRPETRRDAPGARVGCSTPRR